MLRIPGNFVISFRSLFSQLPHSPITTLILREFLDLLMALIRSGDFGCHASIFTLNVSIKSTTEILSD